MDKYEIRRLRLLRLLAQCGNNIRALSLKLKNPKAKDHSAHVSESYVGRMLYEAGRNLSLIHI